MERGSILVLTCRKESLSNELHVHTLFFFLQDAESQSAASAASRKPKKEAMSKSQKRKQWDRMDKGERPRGHDWVDVIKHLSQTGGKDSADTTPPT
jgi:hypothetical protein